MNGLKKPSLVRIGKIATIDKALVIGKLGNIDVKEIEEYDFETPGAGVILLSQGLVKMYYFDNFKPGLSKIKQTLLGRISFIDSDDPCSLHIPLP